MIFTCSHNITTALAASTTLLNLEENRKNGVAEYNFIVGGIFISPSSDALQFSTVVGFLKGNTRPSTYTLQSGIIHNLAFAKIVKSGTTTKQITILGNP